MIQFKSRAARKWASLDVTTVINQANGLLSSIYTKPEAIEDIKNLSKFLIDSGHAVINDNGKSLYGIPQLKEATKVNSVSFEEKTEDECFDTKLCRRFLRKRYNAKERGIDFSLSLQDVRRLMMKKTCAYSGVKFDDDVHVMTFERKDNTKGYDKSNTVACSEQVNKFKNHIMENPNTKFQGTDKQLIKMFESFIAELKK